MFDKNTPLLKNPEFSIEELTIASTDVNPDGSLDVMFDLHGFTIETSVNFVQHPNNIDIEINSVYILDGGYVHFDSAYFEDAFPQMRKLIIDEYMFNNVCVEKIIKETKLAILLYKGIRFFCNVAYNLKINMAKDMNTNESIEADEFKEFRRVLDKEFREFVNDHKLNKAPSMEVQIVKMYEAAANNTQYFVRIRRTDILSACALGSSNVLEYACYQTKHNTQEECLSRAWMMASYAAQFVGETSMDAVKLVNFTEEEIRLIKSEDNYTTILGV